MHRPAGTKVPSRRQGPVRGSPSRGAGHELVCGIPQGIPAKYNFLTNQFRLGCLVPVVLQSGSIMKKTVFTIVLATLLFGGIYFGSSQKPSDTGASVSD